MKFAANILIWACMTENDPRRNVSLTKKINSEKYQEMFEDFMIPLSKDLL